MIPETNKKYKKGDTFEFDMYQGYMEEGISNKN